jgi:hypothetical protein
MPIMYSPLSPVLFSNGIQVIEWNEPQFLPRDRNAIGEVHALDPEGRRDLAFSLR